MIDGVLNWKKCKRCGKPFDIGTNYDYCYECRSLKKKEEVQKVLK